MADRFTTIVVDVVKLRDYCLSDAHPDGRHKARVFRSRLGLSQKDAEFLRQTVLDAAQTRPEDFRPGLADRYGRRYVLDFEMTTEKGSATVRSAWIILRDEDVLRLTSCFVR